MFSIDGVQFDECYPNRVEKDLDDIKIKFISYDDLIKNKTASNRKRDQIDLENLR